MSTNEAAPIGPEGGPPTLEASVPDLSDQLITREHVLGLLPVLQLSPEHRRRLLALDYPVPFTVVAQALERLGISPGVLTDRMGGSP